MCCWWLFPLVLREEGPDDVVGIDDDDDVNDDDADEDDDDDDGLFSPFIVVVCVDVDWLVIIFCFETGFLSSFLIFENRPFHPLTC